MSVLIDFLKNLRKKGGSKGIFPGLKRGDRKSQRFYVLISLSVIFITILGVSISYFFTNLKKSFFTQSKHKALTNQILARKVFKKETIKQVDKPKKIEENPKKEQMELTAKEALPKIHRVKNKTPYKNKSETKKKKRKKKSFYDYYVLGDKYFKEGNLLKSAHYYEEALKLKRDIDVVNNLVVIYTRLNKFKKAEELIQKFPEERIIYSYLVELVKKGMYAKALNVAVKYKNFDKSGYILFGLGYIYESLEDLKKALKFYKEAYEKNPLNPYFALNYARLLEINGNYLKAYAIYKSIKTEDERIKKLAESRLRELKVFIR